MLRAVFFDIDGTLYSTGDFSAQPKSVRQSSEREAIVRTGLSDFMSELS